MFNVSFCSVVMEPSICVNVNGMRPHSSNKLGSTHSPNETPILQRVISPPGGPVRRFFILVWRLLLSMADSVAMRASSRRRIMESIPQ